MNNSPQPSGSIIITNYFPRKLALIYKRFYEEACKADKRQAISELNTFVEQTLKFLVIYLSAEKLENKGASERDCQIQFRNYLLSKPSIGKSIKYLREFKGDSETGLLYRSFLHAPRSRFLDAVGSFNADDIGRHGGSVDEEAALALFNKHAESVTKAVENLRLFKEFPLMGTTSDGREISLCGVSSLPAELRDDSAALYDNGSKYLSLWPFILIDSSSHTVALNLNDISRTEDGNKRAIYVGASTNNSHDLAMSDIGELAKRIFAALKDKLGLLVEGPRRADLDSFADYDEKIRDFSGRRWLFDDIKTFIETPVQSFFLIVGQPGTGKSTFMKKFPQLRDERQATDLDLSVSAQFFFTHDRMDRYTVERCLHHILAELEKSTGIRLRSKSENEPHLEPERILYRLEQFFAQIQQDDESYKYLPIPIFIDGVDELKPGEIKPFVEAINSLRSIPNIKLVITSRDIDELQNLHEPDQRLQLEKDPRHRADLFNYAQFRLSVLGWEDQFVRELIEKTDGIFLYLTCVINDVRNELMVKEEIGSLPSGLEGYYESILKHRMPARFAAHGIDWEDVGFRILKLICVAGRSLSRRELAHFCGQDMQHVARPLDLLRELLRFDNKPGEVDFFHLSLRDYIAKHYEEELEDAHKLIVNFYRRALEKHGSGRLDDYFHRYIHEHIKAAGALDIFEELVCNPNFHQQRVAWFVTPCDKPEIDPEWGYGYKLANGSRNDRFDLFYVKYLKTLPIGSMAELRHFLLRAVQYYPVLHAHSIIRNLPYDIADHDVGTADAQTLHLLPLLAARYPHFLYTYAVSVRSLWLGALAKLTLLDFDCPRYQPSDKDLEVLRQYLRDDRDWGEWIHGERPPSECQRTLFLYLTGLSDKAIKLLFPDSDSENNDDALLFSERDHDRDTRYPRSIAEYRRCVEKAFEGSVSITLKYLHDCGQEDIELYSASRSLIRKLVQGSKEKAVELLSKVADYKPRVIYLALVEEFLPELKNELSTQKSLSDLLGAYRDYLDNELDSISDEMLCGGDNVAGLEVLIFFEGVLEVLLDKTPDRLLACLIRGLQPRDDEHKSFPEESPYRYHSLPALALLDSTFVYRLLHSKGPKYEEFKDAALKAWQSRGLRNTVSHLIREEEGVSEPPHPFPLSVDYTADVCLERLRKNTSEFEPDLLDRTAPENAEVVLHILEKGVDLAPVSQDLRKQLLETLSMALDFGFNTNQLINKMLEVIKQNIPPPQ